jgi:hypothetical protein
MIELRIRVIPGELLNEEIPREHLEMIEMFSS